MERVGTIIKTLNRVTGVCHFPSTARVARAFEVNDAKGVHYLLTLEPSNLRELFMLIEQSSNGTM